jgi:hexosaminidase
MKMRTLLVALPVLFAGTVVHAQAPAATGPADLMPVPAEVVWQSGRLPLDAKMTVATRGPDDPRVTAAWGRALARLQALGVKAAKATPLAPPSSMKDERKATLVLRWQAAGAPVQAVGEDESYSLTVTPRQAVLEAGTPLGILWGLETLLQLARAEAGAVYVPAVVIKDRPRFPWRGLMIDVARHWQPIEVIKRTLDGMSSVKMNVFHWHLTEDQGFRVESKRYPKLHERGSDGHYFTQEQVKDVIAYARDRGIRVMPEFDMPGHTTSWLVGHPELGSAPGPFQIMRTWGIFDDALDPTREEVYTLLDGFLGEMAALFPDAYMHIGGDEVNGRSWNQNARIQDFMYQHRLRDNHDLQASFNKRVYEIVTRHGKRVVGWDEVLHPDLPRNIMIESWRGPEALAQAARLGYDGMLANGYYLDLNLSTASHYLSDPVPPGSDLPEETRRHILGGEACMWSEMVTPETIDSRIWPRAAAVAERLWSPAAVRDLDDMHRRLETESRRLEAFGLNHRSGYVPMLQKLVGDAPVEPLETLADLVEPVKHYERGQVREYRSDTPLERLVDATRPESETARRFRRQVDFYLKNGPDAAQSGELRSVLTRWRDNHAALEPILDRSPRAAEARAHSRDLTAVSRRGLEALDHLASGHSAPAAWREEATSDLAVAQRPSASELELAVVPAVRKLVLAAAQLDQLAPMGAPAWNALIETQLNAPPRP